MMSKRMAQFVSPRELVVLLLLTMSVVVVTVAWTAWSTMDRMSDLAERADASRVPQMMRLNWIETNVTRMSLLLRQAADSQSPVYLAATAADMDDKRQLVLDALAAFDRSAVSPAARAASEALSERVGEFLSISTANLLLLQTYGGERALNHLLTETMPVRNRLLLALDTERKRQNNLLSLNLQGLRDDAEMSHRQLGVLAVVVAIGLTLCYWLLAEFLYRRERPVMRAPTRALSLRWLERLGRRKEPAWSRSAAVISQRS